MRIISRHFLASYLRLFVTILLGSLLTIVIVEMLLKFDDIVESRNAVGIATYFLLRIPSEYLRDTLPVASFAAAFVCIGGAARAREITALKAGGIPPHRIALPVLLASLVLSAATLVAGETVILSAERGWSRLAHPGQGVAYRRGSFWYHRGNVVYNILGADGAAHTLLGVNVFRLNAEGRLVESLHADRVSVEGGSWILNDATRRSFDPSDPMAPPRLERVSERLDDLGGVRDLASLDAGVGLLSVPELLEYIEVRSADGRDPTAARGRLHRRLADPLSVALFAWLALPLGFAVEQSKSLAVSGLLGIGLVAIYYTMRTLASTLAAGGVTSGALGPWLLLAVFGAFGAWRMSRVHS